MDIQPKHEQPVTLSAGTPDVLSADFEISLLWGGESTLTVNTELPTKLIAVPLGASSCGQ